jgi:photosystem II stability/assembly factor-like uncharacterized protein
MNRRVLLIGFALSLAFTGIFSLFWVLQVNAANSRAEITPLAIDQSGGWENLGLYGAQISYFDFNLSNDIVYACTNSVHGVYESDIYSDQWSVISGTIGGCGYVEYDAINNLVYIVTESTKLKRSEDSGISWQTLFSLTENISGTFDFILMSFHIDPTNPDKLYLGTQGGEFGGTVLYSIDAGETWDQAQIDVGGANWVDYIEAGILPVVVDPTDPSMVYFAASTYESEVTHSGIYRSMDAGLTFQRIVTDTELGQLNVNVNTLGTVFASFQGNTWRSRDNGETWDYIFDMAVGVIYIPEIYTDTVWLNNFRCIKEGDECENSYLLDAAIVHPVVSTTMYTKTPYGISKSDDSGGTWRDINQGLEEVTIWRISVDPGDYRRYFVSTGGAVGYTENDGEDWIYPVPGLGDSYHDIVFDTADPEIIYATPNGADAVQKSMDGGETWFSYNVKDGLGWAALNRLVLDPNNTQTGYLAVNTNDNIYSTHKGGVYKTVNGGVDWISTTLRDVPMAMVFLVSDTLTQTLFAGALNTWYDQTLGGVFVSQDGGSEWERSGLDGIPTRVLNGDPRYPAHIYAGTDVGIYKSLDYGDTWSLVFDQGWIYDLEIDPEDPDHVYAIVNADIVHSTNAGSTWDLLYRPSMFENITSDIHIPWLPPSPVVAITATVVDSSSVRLDWVNPGDGDFMGTEIRYMTTTYPARYFDGILVTDQISTPNSLDSFTHTLQISGTNLYYSAFAYDQDGYYALPTMVTATLGSSGTLISVVQLFNVEQDSYQSTIYMGNARGLYKYSFTAPRKFYLPMILHSGGP